MIYDNADLERLALAVVEVCARVVEGADPYDHVDTQGHAFNVRNLKLDPKALLKRASAVAKGG